MEKLNNKSVKVLLCGAPKSGNYLLFKIIKNILLQNKCWRSFKEQSGLGDLIDNEFSDYKYHPEENCNDVLFVKDAQLFMRFPSPTTKYLTIDPQLVISYSSLLWSHNQPELLNIDDFSSVTHKFYLVRDGRDVINSLMHFVTNPITLKRYPEYRIVDPVTLYEDYAYFDRQVTVWRDHVRSIFSLREQYLLIRFEDLINNKKNTIERIGNYLGLQVQIEEIMQKTSFSTMKKQANEHVRKGKQGDWKNYFTTIHLERFNRIAGSELEMLGYELVDEL